MGGMDFLRYYERGFRLLSKENRGKIEPEKPRAVWFPTYLLSLPSNLKSKWQPCCPVKFFSWLKICLVPCECNVSFSNKYKANNWKENKKFSCRSYSAADPFKAFFMHPFIYAFHQGMKKFKMKLWWHHKRKVCPLPLGHEREVLSKVLTGHKSLFFPLLNR